MGLSVSSGLRESLLSQLPQDTCCWAGGSVIPEHGWQGKSEANTQWGRPISFFPLHIFPLRSIFEFKMKVRKFFSPGSDFFFPKMCFPDSSRYNPPFHQCFFLCYLAVVSVLFWQSVARAFCSQTANSEIFLKWASLFFSSHPTLWQLYSDNLSLPAVPVCWKTRGKKDSKSSIKYFSSYIVFPTWKKKK